MSSSRHQAREAALGALYFWEVGRTEPARAIETYFSEHRPAASDAVRTFATELVLGTTAELAEIDALIQQHTEHWRMERLAIVDRLILRMAAWELRHEADTAPAVILDEAIKLARTFGSDDSVPFVNGVLDAIRKTLGR